MRIKPSYPRLRRSHPLANGLRGFFVSQSDAFAQNLVDGVLFPHSGASPGTVLTPVGVGLDLTSATTRFDTDLASTPAWSVCGVFSFSALVAFARIVVFNGEGTNGAGISLNASNQLRAIVQNGSFVQIASSTVPNLGQWYSLAATYDRSSLRLYIDGRLAASTNTTAATSSLTPFRIGTDNTASGSGNPSALFRCAYVAVYNRGLAPSEVSELDADPFAMLRPMQRSYFAIAGAGPPAIPSGSGSVNAVATITGAGQSIRSGSGNVNAIATITGTGRAIQSGSGVINAIGVLAGSGKQSANGSGSIDAIGTLTGSGTSPQKGSGSVDAIGTLTGTGSAIQSGSGTIDAIGTLSGVGSAPIVGAASGFGNINAIASITGTGRSVNSGSGNVNAVGNLQGVGLAPSGTSLILQYYFYLAS
jgi:hypothetical protein